MKCLQRMIGLAVASVAVLFAGSAGAQETKHYRFAHDQQLNSGYSIAYDIFSARLKELSKGTMLIDQYPGAQLGQDAMTVHGIATALGILVELGETRDPAREWR